MQILYPVGCALIAGGALLYQRYGKRNDLVFALAIGYAVVGLYCLCSGLNQDYPQSFYRELTSGLYALGQSAVAVILIVFALEQLP